MFNRLLIVSVTLFVMGVLSLFIQVLALPTADLSVSIIPSGGGAPALAANAGFTTAIINDDFSLSSYATQSNWVQCGVTDAGAQTWRTLGPAGNIWQGGNPSPCNINQGFDSAAGKNVMIFDWPPGTQGCCDNPNNDSSGIPDQIAISTMKSDNVTGIAAANFFIDNVVRISPPFTTAATGGRNNYLEMTGEGLWTYGGGGATDPAREQSGGLEVDSFEQSLGFPGPGNPELANGNRANHNNDPQDGGVWATFDVTRNQNIPIGYRAQDYHRYSALITSNGTSRYVCMFIDLVLQASCNNVGVGKPLAKTWFNYSWGPFYRTSNTQGSSEARQYVQYGTVWSCPSWNASDATGQCHNNNLVQMNQPNGTVLTYYGL